MTQFRLLMALSVVEIVALIVVLAVFLVLLARQLRATDDTLASVVSCVRRAQGHLGEVGAAVGSINTTLGRILDTLPVVADKAEHLGEPR